MRLFRINLLQGFLYPLTAPRRLLAACLILPISLAVLVPPILFGLGVYGLVPMSLRQGLGLTLGVLLVCVLVGSVPFTFLAGYLLRCRQTVMAGERALPAWQKKRQLFRQGGQMDMLALIFGLPVLILFWGGVASVAVPLSQLPGHVSWGTVLLTLLGSSAGLACLLVALVFWLSALLVSPMATLRLALGETPWRALQPGPLLADIRRGWFDYGLCCVVVWGASLMFQMLQAAFFPLIVVSFPAQVYLQLVWANLLGQFARAYLAERIPAA